MADTLNQDDERAAVEVWANENQTRGPSMDDVWCIYLHGKDAGRASPAAAVPVNAVDAMPPLPEDWKTRVKFRSGGYCETDEAISAMEAEIAAWRAFGAAVEADRARQDQSGHMPPFAAPAGQREITRDDYVLVCAAAKDLFNKSFADDDVTITSKSESKRDAVVAAIAVFKEAIKQTPAPDEQSETARCRAEGGDGAPEAVDVSADRAQQGEPVKACEAFKQELDAQFPIPDSPHTSVIQRAMDNRTAFWFGWNASRRFTERAATKAAAPDCARCPRETPYGPAVCYECADKAAAAPACPTCKGNDADAPCAYPSQGKPGCLRDARMAAAPENQPRSNP